MTVLPMCEPCGSALALCELETNDFAKVSRFYKANGDKAKAKRGETVLVASSGKTWVAVLRLLPCTTSWWCLRSVCVRVDLRGQGIGSRFITRMLEAYPSMACYCFALGHLRGFYEAVGFIAVSQYAGVLPKAVVDAMDNAMIKGKRKGWVPMVYVGPLFSRSIVAPNKRQGQTNDATA